MGHFFLTSHHTDAVWATTLRQAIEAAGFALQQRTPNDVDVVHHDEAIRNAHALLLLATPAALADRDVTYEWAFARGAGIAVIVVQLPVQAHDAVHTAYSMPPQLQELPTVTLQITGAAHDETMQMNVDALLLLLHAATQGLSINFKAEQTELPIHQQIAYKTSRLDVMTASEQEVVHETLTESLNHPMRDVRIQAALMLAQFQDVRAVPVLIDALRETDHEIQHHAVWGILHIGTPAVDELIAAMGDTEGVVRKEVARILGQIGDVRALPVLIDALHDRETNVRKSVAESLGQLKDASATPSLQMALSDDNEHVRRIAAEALGKIGDQSVVEDLIMLLNDPSESVQVVAAWSLGQLRAPQALPALVRVLRTGTKLLRQAVAEVLKEIGTAQNIPVEEALNELLFDEDQEMRRVVARIVAHIRNRHRLSRAY